MRTAGFVYIWSYRVREGCEGDFEALYGSDGAWVRLFRKSPEFLGTDLLRDRNTESHYVTVDQWTSERAHREFVASHRKEFNDLDSQGERLTTKETQLGDFEIVRSTG